MPCGHPARPSRALAADRRLRAAESGSGSEHAHSAGGGGIYNVQSSVNAERQRALMLTTTGAEYIDHSRQRAEVATHSARRGVGVDDASCVRYRTRGAGTHNVRTDDALILMPAFNARRARVPRARGSALHRGRSHSLQTVLSYISSERDRRRATDGETKGERERERGRKEGGKGKRDIKKEKERSG